MGLGRSLSQIHEMRPTLSLSPLPAAVPNQKPTVGLADGKGARPNDGLMMSHYFTTAGCRQYPWNKTIAAPRD
jgi:hypothetical protein